MGSGEGGVGGDDVGDSHSNSKLILLLLLLINNIIINIHS